MIGKTISHYKILEKLGEGGMGVVYKAEDTKLKRNIALKFLPPEMTRNPEAKQRFISEAQTASSLQHNNISTIHEINETDDGRLYICMDYYDGETLRDRIQKETLVFKEIMDMAIQIAEGLHEAHSKGIIHRDIKSANIIITSQNQAKIMDFGLAKLTGQAGPTKTGLTPGTIAYMSPEQTKGETVDSRTDIWSLGVVLYEMVTGQLPFKGEYEQAVIYSILNEDPEPVSQIRKHVPIELENIIEKCLKKKADDRYQTADALLRDLRSLKHQGLISKTDRYTRDDRPVRKFTNKTVRQIILLTLVILMTVAISNYQTIKIKLGLISLPSVIRLAVLPFNNIGDLPENRAYCEGFLDYLTSALTKLEELRDNIIIVPSSEIRDEKITSAREAKETFGANLVVTGSIQRDTNSVQTTVNLVDAESLLQLHSSVIDYNLLANASMLQYNILNELVDMLKIELLPEQLPSLRIDETNNSLAFDYYIEGRGYLLNYQDEDTLNTAIELFEHALEEDEDYALAYAGLGKAYLFKYRLTKDVQYMNKAIQYCNRSLDLNNELTPVRITLGLVQIETGNYDKAAELFAEIIQLDPQNSEAYRELGNAYEDMGRLEDAETMYKKAIELKPLYWGPYNYLGGFYFEQARYSEAIDQFLEVISLAPENVQGYTNLGVIYFYLEEWAKAQKMFENSIRIKPTNLAYHNLATLYFYQQHYEDAAKMYEEALSIFDKDYRVWGALADSYFMIQEKQFITAEKYYQAIALAEGELEVNPQDPAVLADLAGYYANLGDQTKSKSLLNQVIALKPTNVDILYRIAETYLQLDNKEETLVWLSAALHRGYPPSRINQNPYFSDLKSDARFQKILEENKQNTATDEP